MKTKKMKEKQWDILIALILIGIGVLLIIVYYIILPLINSSIIVPCQVNIIITILLSFGISYAYKLSEKKR